MAHPNADQSPISSDWDAMLFATAGPDVQNEDRFL